MAVESDVPAAVGAEVLDDLRARLRGWRRVPLIEGVGWDRGTDADYLADLVAYWAEQFDWRAHEAAMLDRPWVSTGSGEDRLRSVHAEGPPDSPVVVLLHGWPDSFFRFHRVLPLLTDLTVLVPCLPGFPYAHPITRPGMSTARMAEVVATAMQELGHDRYVVSGGDVGSSVAEYLAAAHPERVRALHLTDIPYTHLFTVNSDQLSPEEQDYLAAGQQWQFSEGAYALEQSTKPHTLAVGLGDSPAGLAAWIVEKLRSWSDSAGDIEAVFPREQLLAWITLYWVTGSVGTSFIPYVEDEAPVQNTIDIPTVVSIFPHDLVPAPRQFGERFFDIRAWHEHPDGGHFAAWERPEVFARDLREAVGIAAR